MFTSLKRVDNKNNNNDSETYRPKQVARNIINAMNQKPPQDDTYLIYIHLGTIELKADAHGWM